MYKEYFKYLWYKTLRNTGAAFGGAPMGRPPSAAAPLGLCFLDMFLIILYHRYLWIFLIYSLYIPYIFPSYVKYVFPCVFLNLWSQEKTSPYRKTTEIFVSQILRLLYFQIAILWFYIKINVFSSKIVSFGPLWAHMGPNPDRANMEGPDRNMKKINEFLSKIGPIWAHEGP